MSLNTTPVSASVHDAESRSLWRAVYTAKVTQTVLTTTHVAHAVWAADAAVVEYTKRFQPKLRKENQPSAST